jgi:hypothetical protein
MIRNFSKWGALTISMLIPFLANGGQGVGNGGDICEKRIQNIRDDIGSWIQKGGPEGLDLRAPLTVSEYTNKND